MFPGNYVYLSSQLYEVCSREGQYREVKSGKAIKILIVKGLESHDN